MRYFTVTSVCEDHLGVTLCVISLLKTKKHSQLRNSSYSMIFLVTWAIAQSYSIFTERFFTETLVYGEDGKVRFLAKL